MRHSFRRMGFLILTFSLALSTLQIITVMQAPKSSAVAVSDGLCTAELGSTVTASIKKSGRYCYLTFKSGTNSFTVPAGVVRADLLIIAGGGAGGSGAWGGGGGAGEVVYVSDFVVSSTTSVNVVVGAGGAAGTASLNPAVNRSNSGGNSSVATTTANGGGAGASYSTGATPASVANGSSGGSGGGGAEHLTPGQGGTSVKLSAGLGNNGGNGNAEVAGGGGGGAGGVGLNASTNSRDGGAGGAGTSNFSEFAFATSTGVDGVYAGGGGGGEGAFDLLGAAGGSGGGGSGGVYSNAGKNGVAGVANTGSGGGGASYGRDNPLVGLGGAGGSGVVIVRFAAFSLTYNANATQHQFGVISSGTVPAAVIYETDTAVTVSSNSGNLSRQGFIFGGWNTLPNGLGTNYIAGSGTIVPNTNITLYANWLIPSSARLIGSTGETVTIKNVTGAAPGGCSSGLSGITSDGTYIYYRSSSALSVICKVALDGEFIDSHTVLSAGGAPALSSVSTDNRDLTFSSGCIWLRETGEIANSALYCISIADWTMRIVSTPSGKGLMVGSFWLFGNLIDFPDGRIGSVSAGSFTLGETRTTFGGPNGNTTINCPSDMYCKVLRLYRPSGTGSNVSLTFSEDLVLADSVRDPLTNGTLRGWPNDDHGIATDGTYLYQTKFNSGYKVWALTSGTASHLVFNGAGTGTCQAGTGVSNTLCPINNPIDGVVRSPGTLANATFFGRNHVTNQYFMADYQSNKFYLSAGVAPPAGIGADKSITFTASVATTLKYGSTSSVSYSVNRTLGTEASPNISGTISYETITSTACNINSATGLVTMIRAAGTCQIRVNLRSDTFYTDTSSALVTITPAKADAITVTAANRGSVFTGSAAAITPGFSVTGLQFSDTVTVTYLYVGTSNAGAVISSGEIPSAAGSYSIIPMVTLTNSDSYTAAATTSSGALTISRASRSVSPSTYSRLNLKYGESATVVSNTTSPSTNNDGEFTYAVGSGCAIDSGTGTVTATNYLGTCSATTTIQQGFNYESATATAVSFTLSKADTITVTASSPAAVTYTGSAAAVTPTVSVTGLVAGDSATGATFNYSRAPSCASGGTCQVGDTGPGGGKVFYVSGSVINAVTGISSGGIYLEMAPSTFSKTAYNWCEGSGNPYTTLFGATAITIGSGAANTKIMIDNCTGGAGVQAVNLTLGGQSDWFLPSHNELVEIYSQRTMLGLGTGKYASTYVYWSSTEGSTEVASSLVPWSGVGGQTKAQATPYLPIRAFSPTSTTYESPTSTPTNAGTYRITPSALTLSGGITTDYYSATVYETGTFAINKATQAEFTNYSTLSGVLGLALPVIKFGGSGDGVESIETTNGSATGCAFSGTLLSATAAGTCSVSASKDSSENYAQYDAVFSVNFFYFVPAPAAPVSTRPTEIAIATTVPWSATATAAPKITSISPTTGPVGTVITITGTGLNGITSVRIGRRALTSVTGVDPTSVTAVIPAGATTGPIVVSNSFGSDFIASGFTVTP